MKLGCMTINSSLRKWMKGKETIIFIHSNCPLDKRTIQTRVEDKTIYHQKLYPPGGKNLAI
jgi:hypothetical protein